ncbi:MAG: N-acetyltransferase family protein [Alphaproteobacteria bacterium]
MGADADITISRFSEDDIESHLHELGALLHACVVDGANIGFVLPHTQADAEAFWSGKVLPAVRAGGLAVLIAHEGGRIAGTVQLDYDTMPNQRHRADVRKLLVHPELRRQGIARALMAEVERLAGRLGRRLLTLDTRSGDPAERLYASLGFKTAGIIPGYCRDPFEDRLDPTTIMYKAL